MNVLSLCAVLATVLALTNAKFLQQQLSAAEPRYETLLRQGKLAEYRQQQRDATKIHGSQPTDDIWDAFYLSVIMIGTPAQNFTVVMDTGSSNEWVMDSSCFECQGHHKNIYQSSASSTYHSDGRHWVIHYGSGEASGQLGVDKTCVSSNVCYMSQIFGQASQVAQVFLEQPMVSGIVGLAWPQLSVDNVTPFIQNILSTLDQPLFTVWLDKRGVGPTNNAGLITYGALDTTNCQQSTLQYTPLTAERWWQFMVSGVSIGSFTMNHNWQVISDTGTSWLGGPPNVVASIAQQVPGSQFNGQYGVYMVPCGGAGPNIQFTIGGHHYMIPSTEYIVPFGATGQCVIGMFGFNFGSGFGPTWILGDTWIRAYCQVYHVGGQKIGFMRANH